MMHATVGIAISPQPAMAKTNMTSAIRGKGLLAGHPAIIAPLGAW